MDSEAPRHRIHLESPGQRRCPRAELCEDERGALVSAQRVQSNYMVPSMVSVVVISLMVGVSIPHMGTKDPLGCNLEKIQFPM